MICRVECTRIGSAGRVSENVEVKIVDHITGKPQGVGQKGEVLVRGPAIMTGNNIGVSSIRFSGLYRITDRVFISIFLRDFFLHIL